MKKILLTGFDPFGKNEDNPASRAIEWLDGNEYGDYEVVTLKVPTVFKESINLVTKKIDEIEPDIVINLGLAERKMISIERVGINVDDARIADNNDYQPVDEPIDEEGVAAHFSTLPIRDIMENIREQGIPAKISNSAGTFVCNHLMYGVLNYIDKNDLDIKAGFIHVPLMPEQAVDKNKPTMSLELTVKAAEIAIKTTIDSL